MSLLQGAAILSIAYTSDRFLALSNSALKVVNGKRLSNVGITLEVSNRNFKNAIPTFIPY